MKKLLTAALVFGSLATAWGAPEHNSRSQVEEIVARIQRADYEGDRATLKKCYETLTPFLENRELGSRVRYWRGFDLWRDAINGFNESVDSKELEELLNKAIDEFKESLAKDAAFVDAKIGMISCLGYTAFIHRQEKDRMMELLGQMKPLIQEAKATAPDNPRLTWVLGPVLWYTPAERGGGVDKVIESYEKALDASSKSKPPEDRLDPSWGRPELMMSLAYTLLNRTPPDLNTAERHARAALEIVPHWHYARDILLPQILAAKEKKS
jgi:hypothetical protein